jgi:hypothetical protein
MIRRVTTGVLLLMLYLLIPSSGWAQVSDTSIVVGTVTDPSGAIVTGARVELSDLGTNISRTTNSNGVGQYTFESVLPGIYAIKVNKDGFRPAVVPSIKIDVARSYTINVALVLGLSTEVVKVDVTAQQQLQTTDATIGDVLQHQSLLRLPNVNRDSTTYLFLQPTANPAPSNAPNSTLTTTNSGQIAGARSDQNNMVLDGVDVTDRSIGATFTGPLSQVQSIQPVIPTPAESVEEFRVGITNPTAGFSLSAGGQVTMVTRRGTNSLHGAFYDYFQNDGLNANTWENDLLGQRKSKLIDNRFGVSMGGPIFKDKTFFFANYEGRRFPHSASITRLVPTATLRTGFLRFRDATGNVVSYDLATSNLCGASNSSPCDPRGLGLNPVVSKIWSFLPAGNDPTVGDGLNTTGFTAPVQAPLSTEFGVLRLDHNLNEKWFFTGTFHYAEGHDLSPDQVDIGGLLPSDKLGVPRALANQPTLQRLVTAGLSGAITPSLTSYFRFGSFRNYSAAVRVAPFPQVPGTNVALLIAGGVPGFAALDQPIDADGQRARSESLQANGLEFLESLAWVKGSHTVSFGGSFYRFRSASVSDDQGGLGLTVPVAVIDEQGNAIVPASQRPPVCGGSATSNCLGNPGDVTTWDRLYNATLGIIDNVSFVSARSGSFAALPAGSPVADKFSNYAPQFYFSDAWRLKSSLTVNLGLNYEWQSPPVEDSNRQSFIINQQTNGIISSGQYFAAKRANALQGDIFNPTLAFQPVAALSRRTITNTDWKNVAPRVSVAWNPSLHGRTLGRLLGDRKTVLRGGYSLVYDRMNATNAGIESSLSAFYQGLSVTAPVNGTGQPFRIGSSGDGPAPLPSVPVETLPFAPSVPFGIQFAVLENPTNTIGRAHLVDFTIQRELRSKLLLEFGYVGRLGRNLRMDTTLNAAPYFMVDKNSGQTFAQAYDMVANQLRAGVPATSITAQPWFENYVSAAGSGCGGGTANATQCLAMQFAGSFVNGNVSTLWQTGMDFLRLFNGQTPGLNLQIIDPIVRVGGSNANYNALIVSLHRQMSDGFTFDLNYTFSRSLDYGGNTQDNGQGFSSPFNPKLDYGISQFDRKHVVNAHWYLDIPVGKGHRFGANKAADKLIGGWYLAGIFTANSGLPLCPSYGSGAFGGGLIIAPANCGVPIKRLNPGGSIHHLATGQNLFANPQAVLDNYRPILISQDTRNPRGTLRGLPAWRLDLSIGKITHVTERLRLAFSADLINAFNHPLFGDPTLDMTSPGTFGAIPVTERDTPRAVQLGLRIEF